MRFSAISTVFILIGAAALLYFIYYFVVPIIASGYYLNTHYAASKYENGFFFVKLKKTDDDFWVYTIDTRNLKIKDVGWTMLDQHKRAYQMYIGGRDDTDETN